MRLGQWVATFIAPPPEGIAWRATFAASEAPRLADVRVVVTDSGFPGGIGWQRLPAWLPQDRAVWTATATWVLRASLESAGPPAPRLAHPTALAHRRSLRSVGAAQAVESAATLR